MSSDDRRPRALAGGSIVALLLGTALVVTPAIDSFATTASDAAATSSPASSEASPSGPREYTPEKQLVRSGPPGSPHQNVRTAPTGPQGQLLAATPGASFVASE